MQNRFAGHVRAHDFVLAAALILAGDIALASTVDWSDPRWIEAGILFDLGLLLPALYLWLHRARGKAALVRALALSCLGIWVAGHVVPDEQHRILSEVGFVRYVGLAVLILIEIKLGLVIARATFRRSDADSPEVIDVARDAGMPEWAARFMAWECALWRRAWEAIRRVFRGSRP